MADNDSNSGIGSNGSDTLSDSEVENIILEEPLFYVLGQFLRTEDGTNVATCIQQLTNEVKELKVLLASSLASKKE